MIVVVQTLVYFRESIFSAINKALGYLSLSLGRDSDDGEDEEFEEVFSDYDEKTGVVFFPPVYLQRYAAVLECLMDKRWRGKIEKVVDFGYNDASFINHLKALPDIKTILGVDLEALPLECAYNHLDTNMKENMKIGLYQGNAADPDYRLIGCDAVVAIEMIEHMLPHDLDRLVHNIFGFIKPQLVVITTPNGDFNVLFKALMSNGLRRLDHYFEWSRTQFHEWCSNIVTRYPLYTVTCKGIGPGPEGTEHLGCCSQLALFVSNDYRKQLDLDINSLVQVSEVKNSEENSSSEWKDTGTDLDTLNCTISHVKRYLKDTMDLITKNSDSPLFYMKSVVGYVNDVTKKSDLNTKKEGPIWNNINWGNNTPYWNQYYKVVKEWKYPFEDKQDKFDILNIISEEVDRIVQENKDLTDQIVIPMSRVMDLVKDVTDDEAYVREYFEWNDCELIDDMLLFPRPLVETTEDVGNDVLNVKRALRIK